MNLESIVKYLIDNNITIATMESCTGGLLASLITDVPDASSILKFSAVTYSTEFKIKIPSNKKKIYVISLVSIILVILRCLDYDIIEHFTSIFDGFLGSFFYEIFKTIITKKAVE